MEIFTIEMIIVLHIILFILMGFIMGLLILVQDALICQAFVLDQKIPTLTGVVLNKDLIQNETLLEMKETTSYKIRLWPLDSPSYSLDKRYVKRKLLLDGRQVLDDLK